MTHKVLISKLVKKRGKIMEYEVVFENRKTSERVISEDTISDGDFIRYNSKKGQWEVIEYKKSPFLTKVKEFISIFFSFILLIFSPSVNAVSICGDNGAVFDDDNLCSAICSSCSPAVLLSSGASGTCDKDNYQSFVYFNGKTYALSKNKGFWEDFSNLAVIPDEQTNRLLASIISQYNLSAWIGLYDPNQSQSFNSIDKSRFVWADGTSLTYDNFANGEPNNYIADNDVGVVPILGEHWVYMYPNGTWNDEGYHSSFFPDYKPKFNALIEWNGALDCVNASADNTSTSPQNIIDDTCNGVTPCYVCPTNNGFEMCSSGKTTFNYKGSTLSLNQYSGQIIVSASGGIDYCFNYNSNTNGCLRNGIEAIKSWIVFIGDDGKYYWLGNPNNSPICKGNLQLNLLQYEQTGNSLTINIPQGVRFIEISDVESLSKQCTSDNKYNLTVTIQPAYLCPQNRVRCDATNEEPLCPEGTLNPDRDMCQADATITCPSGYTWDASIDKCVMQYQCPEGGILNKQKDRCEKAFTPTCPTGYTADLTNRVCYKQVDCGIGSFNPSLDRCEYPMTKTCPTGYTLNGNICQKSPTCPTGTTYSTTLDKCITNYTVSCPTGYTWTGQRCETTNIICPDGYSYNTSTDRCEKEEKALQKEETICNSTYCVSTSKNEKISFYIEYWSDIPSCASCDRYKIGNFTGCLPYNEYTYKNISKIVLSEALGIDANYIVDDTEFRKLLQEWWANFGCGGAHYGPQYIELVANINVYINYYCNSGTLIERDKSYYCLNIANPSCPSGGTFDPNADVCYINAIKNCPTGTTLDNTLNKCIAKATCNYGSLNTNTDLCEIVYTPSCPSSWNYDANRKVCYQPISCDFLYNAGRNRCEATIGYDCGSYTYNQTDDICIKSISCPTDKSFPLSNTITYNRNLDVCMSNAKHDCPSGANYRYTWNSTPVNKCELIPICVNGQYNPANNKCYLGDFTCPLGSQYQCVTMADGKNYCSNIPCGDALYANNYNSNDTPEGVNDKKADGQINEDGECLGTIYIFNGQDKRCRPRGTQTYYNDCCKKDAIELLNLVTLGKCNSNEQYLAKLRDWGKRDGKCHYVGEYCAEEWKWPGGRKCVQKKKTFCCFSSALSRIIQEQGRQQLGISWGTPRSPDCRGFTPEEFQKIDWNKIDFSEWIENEIKPNIERNLQDNLQNTINNIRQSIQNKYN